MLLFALLLFVWNAWGYDLWAPDEPYFAEGAREMVVDGEWLVPHVNGEITTDKPPLFFWLISLASLPFGAVSAFTARLPSILAALGTVALTMELASRMAGKSQAVLAGGMLVTTHMFWDKARSSQIDSLLCFLVTLAVFHFVEFRAGRISGRRAGLVFWAAAALAVLAKGPVGVLIPLGIALTTLAVDRSLRSWRGFAPFLGPTVFVAVIATWITCVTLWGGDYSVIGAFREHVVERAVHGMHHVQPPWYYLTVLPYALLPWSFLLPGALLLAWRRRADGDDRFLLIYFLFVVVFFSLPTEKRDLYILPALPAFALIAARLVSAAAGRWAAPRDGDWTVPGRKWVTVPQGTIGVVLVLASIAAPIAAAAAGAELVRPAYVLSAVLGVGGLSILIAALRGLTLRAIQLSGATMALAMLMVVSLAYPALNPQKSARELAAIVREETAQSRGVGQPVLGFDLGNVSRGVSFYSDGIYLEEVGDEDELVAKLASPTTIFLVGNEETLPELSDEVQKRMTVIYRTQLSRRNLALLRFDP